MILNIRGTNGSGKTTLVKKLITDCEGESFRWHSESHELVWEESSGLPAPKGNWRHGLIAGYYLGDGIRVLGPYHNDCGGADQIHNIRLVDSIIRTWHEEGFNIIFEGIIISTIWSRFAQMAHDLPMTIAYLDTPPPICIERIKQRNGGKAFKEELVWGKDATMIKPQLKKAAAEGVPFAVWEYETAYEQMLEFLRTWAK